MVVTYLPARGLAAVMVSMTARQCSPTQTSGRGVVSFLASISHAVASSARVPVAPGRTI